MEEHKNINFIPERINKKPAVYKGMTFYELMVVTAIGASVGFLVGVFIMFFYFEIPIIPTCMAIFAFISIQVGGLYISRLKRGRPQGWLDRFIEYQLFPTRFITDDNIWSIKRSKKSQLRGKNNK